MTTPDSAPELPPEGPLPAEQHQLAELFAAHRERLRLMVGLRLDRRVQGRLDPSDVLQEAFLEASRRYAEYLRRPTLSPYLWLRFLTAQQLLVEHRRHLQAQARDAAREVPLDLQRLPDVSSAGLADCLLDSGTSPSQALARDELRARLLEALERLDPADREVLALRHFEQLSHVETAEVLGLQPAAASMRYYRALKRLREALGGLPGWDEASDA